MIHNGEEVYGVIYLITHIESGKNYVGKTTNFISRIKNYKALHCKCQSRLYNALKKYGPIAFTFEVIDKAYSEQALNELECAYIEKYDSIATGYNCKGGGVGGRLSAETKAKISVSHKGMKLSEATKAKLKLVNTGNTYRRGCKLSEEHKAKIGAAFKGRKLSEEHKANLRASGFFSGKSTRGCKLSDERKAQISLSKKGNTYRRGIKHSDAAKAKMSAATKGRTPRKGIKHSDAAKAKISAAAKGRKLSEAHKAKLSALLKGNKICQGRIDTAETRKKRSLALIAYNADPAVRARKSRDMMGNKHACKELQ